MKFLIAILLTLISALSAAAAPCVVDTLDDYIALGGTGCSIGPFLFKDFDFLNIAGPSIDSSDITVTPSLIGTVMSLRFDSTEFTLSSPQSSTHELSYIVDAPPIIIRFEDAMGSFSFNAQSPITPAVVAPAVSTITTDVCATVLPATTCPPGTAVTVQVFDDGISPQLTDDASFPPSNFLDIVNTIELDASGGGTADFEALTNNIQYTPEPGTSGLLAGGGLLLAWWRRKRS